MASRDRGGSGTLVNDQRQTCCQRQLPKVSQTWACRQLVVPRAAVMKVSRKAPRKVVAYCRTSSAANVRTDKDSEKRQRATIESFAKRAGLEIVDWFYDPAVSGADPIEVRPGFSALLDRIENNGVRTVIVEDASRFARDLVAQELGVLLLIKRNVRVLTANGDDLTDTSDPSRVMMRQIAGSFAQYEKTRLVTKLRGARERIRETRGKCEGRKSYAER